MTEFVDPQWKKQYEQLVAFKRKHGHCIVPQRYQGDASLGKWVSNQRRINVNNKLRVDRKGLLDEIGFVWRVYCTVDKDTPWNKQYEKLVEFKRKNGHCLVPKRYEDDTSLAIWVSTQRASNILPLDRKDLLNKLGFVWRIDKDASWNKQYEKLLAFKRKNGHCLVPQRYQGDVSFGKWVANQRNFHSNNKIRPDRKKLLDEIGFVRKADTRTAHSSTTDVSCRHIASHFTLFSEYFSHSRSCCSAFNFLCVRIRIRKRPTAVWVFQTKHQKKRGQDKAMAL
jgi:hypothetical protein